LFSMITRPLCSQLPFYAFESLSADDLTESLERWRCDANQPELT